MQWIHRGMKMDQGNTVPGTRFPWESCMGVPYSLLSTVQGYYKLRVPDWWWHRGNPLLTHTVSCWCYMQKWPCPYTAASECRCTTCLNLLCCRITLREDLVCYPLCISNCIFIWIHNWFVFFIQWEWISTIMRLCKVDEWHDHCETVRHRNNAVCSKAHA